MPATLIRICFPCMLYPGGPPVPADWERRQRLRTPKYAASAASGGMGKDSCGGFIVRTKPIGPRNMCDGKKGAAGVSPQRGDAGGAESVGADGHTSGVSKAVGAEGKGASSCPYVVVPASSRDSSLTWAASCAPPTPAPPVPRPHGGQCSVVWEGGCFIQLNIYRRIVICKCKLVHASWDRWNSHL